MIDLFNKPAMTDAERETVWDALREKADEFYNIVWMKDGVEFSKVLQKHQELTDLLQEINYDGARQVFKRMQEEREHEQTTTRDQKVKG